MIEKGVRHINCVTQETFISMLENVVENTPKVALLLFKMKPFPNAETFINSLDLAIDSLSPTEKVYTALSVPLLTYNSPQIRVLTGIPDLAGRLAQSNLLSPESTREQSEAGLDLLTEEERKRLRNHNQSYRDIFGFTFVICARQNKAAAILAGLSGRWSCYDEQTVSLMFPG